MFADLQERRVAGGFDEISGRIDLEEPWPFAADLAGKKEARRKSVFRLEQLTFIGLLHIADGAADDLGGLEHRLGSKQIVDGAALAQRLGTLAEKANHRLGGGEIAGCRQREYPLARLRPAMQLLEGRDSLSREDTLDVAVGCSRKLVDCFLSSTRAGVQIDKRGDGGEISRISGALDFRA